MGVCRIQGFKDERACGPLQCSGIRFQVLGYTKRIAVVAPRGLRGLIGFRALRGLRKVRFHEVWVKRFVDIGVHR